jgi:hypothetical protein
MAKYCPDCGGPLLNQERCSCGWKARAEKESLKTYPEDCMVVGCKHKTDVVVWKDEKPITRCSWHYSEDLKRSGKHQMRERT